MRWSHEAPNASSRFRSAVLLVPCVLAFGCGDDGDSDSGGGDCTGAVTATTRPATGAMDVHYRAPLELTLSQADASATLDADFETTKTTRDGGKTIVFTPKEPLAPETSYTVSFEHCGGTTPLTFKTSSYGKPVANAAALTGKTWATDFRDLRYTKGKGLGDILESLLIRKVLVSVVAQSG